MKAYIYQGALHCEECARDYYMDGIAVDCDQCGRRHADLGLDCKAFKLDRKTGIAYPACDESLWDSDAWPKGPYSDGGGEADSPQHCAECGEFLDNPLTPEGIEFVRKAIADFEAGDDTCDAETIELWKSAYGAILSQGRHT